METAPVKATKAPAQRSVPRAISALSTFCGADVTRASSTNRRLSPIASPPMSMLVKAVNCKAATIPQFCTR